jgi:methyl-accepting chemotaxis protein WspA
MFKDLSIKKKLYLSFSAILAIILVLLTIAFNRFNSLSDANAWDRHTMEVIQAIDGLRNDLLQVQVEARGYYLTGTPQRLERARKELLDIPASVQKLQKLTADNPDQVARFKKLETMINAWSQDVIESHAATLGQHQFRHRRSV